MVIIKMTASTTDIQERLEKILGRETASAHPIKYHIANITYGQHYVKTSKQNLKIHRGRIKGNKLALE